uniref:Uncharacterized protein n=1 Tax=Anguilla anguilla TaxID=7936 RepID=A0A0E9QDS2_ANGAN
MLSLSSCSPYLIHVASHHSPRLSALPSLAPSCSPVVPLIDSLPPEKFMSHI